MDFKELLTKKRNGELNKSDIKFFVDGVASGEINERQVVEFVKLINQLGMTNNEVYYLADLFADTGIKLNLGKELGFCVDKHSAGNVSDGMSLILMSVLSSLDIKFVRVVSRNYGCHGTMLGKLNTFKGFNALISKNQMIEKANSCGVGLMEGDDRIAPVAALVYQICKKNNLLIEPIVSASLMANKIATGAKLLIIDVKAGEGAVVGKGESELLANRLVELGKLANIQTVSVVTDLNWPISASVGTSLQIQEIKDTLSLAKEYIGSNLLKLAKEMVICVLMAGGKALTRSQASSMFDKSVENGKAYEKFCSIISTYGGTLDTFDRTENLIDTAVSYITADYDGYIGDIVLDKLYSSVDELIGEDKTLDESAGLVLMCAEGDKVTKGQKIAKVFYSHSNKRYFKVAGKLFESFVITKDKPTLNNLFYKVVV